MATPATQPAPALYLQPKNVGLKILLHKPSRKAKHATSFVSPFLSERTYLGLRHANKVVVPHANRIAVRSGVEDDRLICGQRLIYVRRQVVKRTEGRHGARLTIGKETAEFLLGG